LSTHRRLVTTIRLLTSDAACERSPNGKHGAQEVHRQPVLVVELICRPSYGFLPSVVSFTVIEITMPILFRSHRVGPMLEVGYIDLVFMIRHGDTGEVVAVWSRIERETGKISEILKQQQLTRPGNPQASSHRYQLDARG
jgi:hypothetical protein